MRFKEFVVEAPNPNATAQTTANNQQTSQPPAQSRFTLEVPRGNRGPEVMDMQKALIALGYPLPKFGADGIRGRETSAAVRKFQQDNQLKVDGIPGNDTISKLNTILASKPEIASTLTRSTASDVKPRAPNISPAGLPSSGIRNPNAALKEPEFLPKLDQVARRLGIERDVLLNVMRFESKLDPQAVNPMSRATGLIQFMPRTAGGLGTSVEELYNMSATDQLDYVEKYYKQNGVKPGATVGDLYILTFMPAAANKPDDFVLGNSRGGRVFNLDASRVYAQNRVFDQNGDGVFTKADVINTINQRFA